MCAEIAPMCAKVASMFAKAASMCATVASMRARSPPCAPRPRPCAPKPHACAPTSRPSAPAPAPSPSPQPSPTPPLLHRPKNGLQQHLTRENRSYPYLTGPLRSHDPRNPHLTRIFRDVCVSKSSRSPPHAAARNFCKLKIFYRPACSIFGAPKFSTCDKKNVKARPIKVFGHL